MKRKKKFAGLAAAAMALCLGIAPLSACSNNGGNGGNEGGGGGGDDEPIVHTHSGGTATCLTKAVCTECGEAYGELGAHDYKSEKHDATCTEDGYTTETCSVCKDAKTTVIAAVGHNYGKTEEKATCTTDGVATYTCEACGDSYDEITTKSAGHTTKANAVWTPVATAPDDTPCLVHVVENTDCANCNEKITRNIDIHKPSYRATVTKVATCSQAGTIQYTCSCNNAAYTYTEEIAKNANAHTWVPVTARATATHECSECGATKTEVAKEGTTATITADDLKGENIAIAMTDTQTTLQPDAALAEKMGGAEVKVETKPATELEISNELKEQIGDSPVYDFAMTNNGQAVDFAGAKMTVSVPYELADGEDPTAITVLYIDEKGESHDMNAVYSNGFAVFEVEHFSYYTVVRLTPAQRCAKIGHDYKNTVVAETCTSDGYTLQNCRRCGDHQTTEGKKATGHDYAAQVVKPTCTAKGYTIYTCKNCPATYIADYTKETPHAYTDKVVAPTCTAKGYTEHTCKDCGKQYKDTYTAATGHKYTGGACSVCGAKDPSVSDNFYFNLIESIDPTAGVYIDMSNITFEYTFTGTNGGGSGNKPVEPQPQPQPVEPDIPYDPSVKPMAEGQATKYTENNKVVINLYRFTFRIDENDNLEAKGEGKMKITSSRTQEGEKPEPQVMDTEVKLVIKDGKVYTFSKSVEADGTHTYYSVSPLSDGSEAQFKAIFEQVYTKELAEVLTALQGQKNSPVNGAIAKVVEYIFTKEETNSGYTFTLDTDRVKEVITILTTESANKVFDRVFGEGAYKETYDWIYALPKKTVAQLKTEVFGWLVKTGISEKALYSAVNSVVNAVMPPEQGGEPFDISALLTANGETTIAELIAGVTGNTELTAEALQATIEQYGAMLSDEKVPVADLVAQMAGAPLEGSVADIVKAYEGVINGLSKVLKDEVAVTFTTDKTGAFLGFAADFDQFEYTLDESVIGAGSLNIKLDGGMTLVPGGDFISDANTIVTKLDNALKTLDITEDKKLVRYGENYTLKKVGDKVYLLPEFDIQRVNMYDKQPEITDGSYNGVACKVMTVETYDSAYRLAGNSLSLRDHCTPWVNYDIRAEYANYTVFKVYVSNDGKEILGTEYDFTAIEEYFKQNGTWSTSLYYNTVTGEFAAEEQHKYELVDSKEAECKTGGEGYEKYRCTVCGETYTRTTYKSHETRQSIVLKGTTCEDGIIVTYTCTVCGEVDHMYETEGVYEDGSHITRTSRSPIKNEGGCPDLSLVQRKCLCGQFVEDIRVEGRCEFDYISEETTSCTENENRVCEHGHHDHRVAVYRCSVTNCAYTYTVETYLVPTETTCVYTYNRILTLKDETKYTITRENYEDHDYRYMNTTEELVEIEKSECQYCHKVSYMTTRTYQEITVGDQTYKVLIRYYRNEGSSYSYGYERVYENNDPCHYVEYELDENEQRVGEGVPGISHKYSTTVSEEHSEGNIKTITYHCQTCNETVSVESYQVYEVNLSDGKTQHLERVVSSYDERNDGFVREYNGCSYIEYYIQDGVKTDKICGEGIEHMSYIDMNNKAEYQAPTCTQYGHYTIHCVACNSDELVYLSELGHYYIPEENGEGYYCQTCGMHNAIEADGPISLESAVTADSVIVGYNDRFDRENLVIDIFVNNGTDDIRLALDPVVDSCKATGPELLEYYQLHDIYGIYDIRSYGECGIITIDKVALLQELEKLAASGVEIKDISVCVTVNGKHMPEDEYDDFIEQSVTFTLAELSGTTEEPAPETPVETPVEGTEEQVAA